MSVDFAALLRRAAVASPLPFALNARRCHRLDLSAANPALKALDPGETPAFSAFVRQQIAAAGADYAAGGYGENRALYAMSKVFKPAEGEPRTLHLGIDLWLPAGTAIHAVLPGVLHSAQDNAAFGDYGPTLIFEHVLEGQRFYTLYGHLSRPTLARLRPGTAVAAGAQIGWLGVEQENVGWPPHLHFQIIRELGGRSGDYPGVCAIGDAAEWLALCPNPNLLLRIQALEPSL